MKSLNTPAQSALNETDILRAHFAPNDSVSFKYRRRVLRGTLLRTNPARAIIRVDHEEYHVPYACLTADDDTGRQREARVAAVHELALELMHKHGLKKWKFKFDHSTRRAGCCNYHEQCISIAFELARNAADNDIRDTLLHEIAHALVGKKHHHDAEWKATAREIGGTGERCHRLQFAAPRYTVSCENDCWTHTAERRNRRLLCRTCGGKLVYSPYSARA